MLPTLIAVRNFLLVLAALGVAVIAEALVH